METHSIKEKTLFMSVRDYFIAPIDVRLASSFSLTGGREFVRALAQFVFCIVWLALCIAAILLPIAITVAVFYVVMLYVFAYILFFIVIAFLFCGFLFKD